MHIKLPSDLGEQTGFSHPSSCYTILVSCSDLDLELDRSKNAGNNSEYHTV
jgi:hypothetical protein